MTKKLIMAVFVLSVCQNIFAQRYNSYDNRSYWNDQQNNNELRINFMMSIAGMPEINYERYLSESMGVGMAVAFSIENAKDMHLRSMALPYCRIYFGQKRDDGFFIEGNMAMVNQQEEITESINNGTGQITTTNSSTNFGFGAATGFKLLARGGVTGEVYLGVGRLFGNSISGAYPRCGLCIGKRF